VATDQNDVLLGQMLAGQEDILDVLRDIRDRLPAPTQGEPTADGGEPVEVREPAPLATTPEDQAPEPVKEPVPKPAGRKPAKKTTMKAAERGTRRARGKSAST
jgi:hypothetical protein